MPRRFTFAGLGPDEQPLLYLAAALSAGVAAATSMHARLWLLAAGALCLGCAAIRRGRWVLLLAGCGAAGGALGALDLMGVGEGRVRRLLVRGEIVAAEPVELWGRLEAAPELAPDRIYLNLSVERVATLGRGRAAAGIVRLVVPFADAQARADYDALGLDYGTRLRAWAEIKARGGYLNPGAPDFDEMLEHRGYDAVGVVKSPLLIEPLGAGRACPLLARLYRLRARGLRAILRGFAHPTSGLLAAGLFGNHYFLPRDTAESFRAGGTFHLLVISGSHVALIALVAFRVAERLIRARVARSGLVLALIWAYGLMVGGQPAITRAAVMLTVALGARLVFRDAAGANTLGAAALVLLVWRPGDLFNPGFQLSFLTVMVMSIGAAPLYTRLRRIGEWRPSALTPYPPRAPAVLKWCAELLFWNEAAFRREVARAPIRYRLEKSRAARRLSLTRPGRAAQRALGWAAAAVLTTAAIQVGLLPVMIAYFHRVTVVALATNVIDGALVSALLIAGGGYLLLDGLSAPGAAGGARLVDALGRLTAHAADPLLAWRGASFRVPDHGEHSAALYACFFALALALVLALDRWNPLRLRRPGRAGSAAAAGCAAALAALGLWLAHHPTGHEYERGRLAVTFLDVGQGDAIVVSFPRGGLMLVDSGGRARWGEDEGGFVEDRIGIVEAAVAPYLWRRGVKRLDLIAATHGDADHVEGFTDIARGFEVGAALTGPGASGGAPDNLFTRAARLAGVPLRLLRRGDGFELDGVRVTALAPFADGFGSENDRSLVLRLEFGARSVLLTGDIERAAEARLIAAGGGLRADVLKVAHHGSRTSSTAEFLARVNPAYAVISAADPSPFGHPHPEVVARLGAAGARVLETSRCGAITISTDGRDLRAETFVPCH